ncbi:MAG: hypothetical protein Fur0037_14400 [Planctomycetota bacterium]
MIRGAIRLLSESDERILHVIRERILSWGEAARPGLERLREHADPRIRSRVRRLLRELDVRACLARFAELDLGLARGGSSLLKGCAILSQMTYSFAADEQRLARWIAEEAAIVRERAGARGLPARARVLAERLAGERGLRGDGADGSRIGHVSVDRVLLGGLGIPVSLSLIYLLVAREAGFSAAGVAMPDHFLVRLHGNRPILLDPFHGGRTVTKVDCIRYLKRTGRAALRQRLRDLSDREVLAHYLRALRGAARWPVGELRDSLGNALWHLEAN